MKYSLLFLLTIARILRYCRGTTGVSGIVFIPTWCPLGHSPGDVGRNAEFDTLHSTGLLTPGEDPFGIRSDDDEADESDCTKDTLVNENLSFHPLRVNTRKKNGNCASSPVHLCPSSQDSSGPLLLPVSGNCSQFYKCDWGRAVLFSCPLGLHFNAELGVCDWPWRARCDSSWSRCPRPRPKCPHPGDHQRTLYLPHPRVCEKFYQCDWGTPYLQSCPRGLHFDPAVKTCDWPHRANCRVC